MGRLAVSPAGDDEAMHGLEAPAAADEFASQRPIINEKFRRSLAPEQPDPARYDKTGRVRLGLEFTDWLAGPDNWLGTAVTASPPTANPGPWKIATPLPGTTLLLDPDLPHGGQALPLRTQPPRPGLQWSSPTLQIKDSTAWLIPGQHQIHAHDPTTGQDATTWVEVRRL
jgi:hypothetical protein